MLTTGKLLLAVVLITVIVAGVTYAKLQSDMDKPMLISAQGLEYTLVRGGTLRSVVVDLSRLGVLQPFHTFMLYSRLSGRGSSIKAGDYFLTAGTTPRQLLKKLEQGDVHFFQLTLVEGWNMSQVLAAVRAQSRLLITLDETQIGITADQLGIDPQYPSLEGLLFPDTYRYQSGTTDVALLQQAYERLQQVLQEEWQSRAENLPYNTPYEALIMASLIEKETGVAAERAEIAGVFVRRLQKDMRLQTDPSIIYGLGADFDGNLSASHLKDASNPYNTYRHDGLTPTPIALVGREAIHAALHPTINENLYFVAKGDGSHYFSSSLEQHQRAVRKYQISQRRKDYSSAPKIKPAG